MRDVALVLRGMWFRRWTSVAVLIVSALVVGGAATGPLFLRAADESVLHDIVQQDTASARVLDNSVQGPLKDSPLPRTSAVEAERLPGLPLLRRLLDPPIRSLEVPTRIDAGGSGGGTKLVYRDDVCAHVRMADGRCPTAPDDVMVSAQLAHTMGWRVGQQLSVGDRPSRIVGTYVPLDVGGDYWSGHFYFQAQQGVSTFHESADLDAVFAPYPGVTAQAGTSLATATVDRHLREAGLRLAEVPELQRELTKYAEPSYVVFGQEGYEVQVATTLPAALTRAVKVADSLRLPVVVVTAQLLVLCWLVLFLVVANGAEARGPEVALAKLRGVPTPVTLGFGVADSLLLVLASVPVGLGLSWLWVGLLSQLQLAPGTPVVMTGYAVLAALGAGVGAMSAAVLAAWSTLRRPVVEQWRRTTRRSRPRPWLVDLAVVAVAVPGAVLLLQRGSADRGLAGALTLAAPGLMVLAVAMLASRALPAICRSLFARTRRRARTAGFLAVRQIARRPSTLRQALVLAAAFGLVTFAVSAWSVARANAHDRAWTEVGAAEVLTVYVPDRQDVGTVVDRLDPSGRQATTVSTVIDYQGSGEDVRELLAVEPSRFARIAFWRGDFGSAPLASLVRRLTVPVAPAVTLRGDRIAVDVDASPSLKGLSLVADVAAQRSGLDPETLGRIGRPGLQTQVTCQTQPCRLIGFHLERPGVGSSPITGRLTVRGVRVHDTAGWHDLDADLGRSSWWRTAEGASVDSSGSGLGVTLRAASSDEPSWTIADHPTTLPALLSPTHGPVGDVSGLDDQRLRLHVVGRGPALPNAGAQGVMVSRAFALRVSNSAEPLAQDTVWLSPRAAGTFARRLEAAGATVIDQQSAPHQTTVYRRQGPALALLLFVAAAVLGAVLAAGGTVLTLYLAGRRRSYEIAAMRAVGVRPRTLVAAIAAEQGILLAFGIAVGVVSGWAAAWVTLPTLPEFADVPMAPPLLYDVPLAPVLLVVGISALVLALVVLLTAHRLVRGASFDQLREAPA